MYLKFSAVVILKKSFGREGKLAGDAATLKLGTVEPGAEKIILRFVLLFHVCQKEADC